MTLSLLALEDELRTLVPTLDSGLLLCSTVKEHDAWLDYERKKLKQIAGEMTNAETRDNWKGVEKYEVTPS